MGPQGRIGGEVSRKNHELAIGQRPPESNKHKRHQALSLAELSIAAQQAQSHHLAFKFSPVHASSRWLSASDDSLKMSCRKWA